MLHILNTISLPLRYQVFAQTNSCKRRIMNHPNYILIPISLILLLTSGGVSCFCPGKKFFFTSSSSSSSSFPFLLFGFAAGALLLDFFGLDFEVDLGLALSFSFSLDLVSFDFGVSPLLRATFFFFLSVSEKSSSSAVGFLTFFFGFSSSESKSEPRATICKNMTIVKGTDPLMVNRRHFCFVLILTLVV